MHVLRRCFEVRQLAIQKVICNSVPRVITPSIVHYAEHFKMNTIPVIRIINAMKDAVKKCFGGKTKGGPRQGFILLETPLLTDLGFHLFRVSAGGVILY